MYIDEPVYEYDHLIGDCPWLCGFWVNMRQLSDLWGWDGSIGTYTVDGEGNVQTFNVYSGSEIQYSDRGNASIIGCKGQIAWIGFLDYHEVYPGDEHTRHTDIYIAACNAENGEYSDPIYLGSGYSWNYLFPLRNVGYTESSYTDITPSGDGIVGYTKLSFIDIAPSGDVTVQTTVYEGIYIQTPVITETTIPCPWSMISGNKLSLFSGDEFSLSNNTSSSIESDATYEPELRLPFPNPTMEMVNISFTLANSGPVSIVVYDLSGRIVYNHARGDYSAGSHNVSWSLTTNSGNRAPSGMYLIFFESEDLNETHRLVIID